MRQMQIAFNGLFLQNPATGTGQYTLHLLEALAARGDEHSYLVCVDPGGYRPAGLGARVETREVGKRVRGKRLRKLYLEQVGFPLTARHQGADVAHVPYFGPPLHSPCPVVVTIHDLIPLILPEYGASALVRAYNVLVAAAARRASAVIADSRHSRDDIVRLLGIPEGRVRVVYLAAESRYRPVVRVADMQGVRQRYGLPERFVFYVGGLNRHKNVGTLLQAWAALKGQLSGPVTLAVAGRAQSNNAAVFPDLRLQARDLGLTMAEAGDRGEAPGLVTDVRFLNFVSEEDKPLLYAAADLFVFPSLYEGFGLPPLEAMACGTPVVCSAAASLPEIVGEGGLLVDPSDVAALASAIRAVLTDDALRASLRARALAQAARFSWEATAEQTVRVYEEVASARQGAARA